MSGVTVLAVDVLAVTQQEREMQEVGTASPVALALTVALLVAVILLGRSMARHLKRLPRSFDAPEQPVDVPDSPAGLFEQRPAGEELMDQLRRAPRAIEGPRPADPDEGPGARP